jgi:ankyrin repeat protein
MANGMADIENIPDVWPIEWQTLRIPSVVQVDLIVQRGVDIDIQNRVGWTAVHAAADGGHLHVLQLLDRLGAQLEVGRLSLNEPTARVRDGFGFGFMMGLGTWRLVRGSRGPHSPQILLN